MIHTALNFRIEYVFLADNYFIMMDSNARKSIVYVKPLINLMDIVLVVIKGIY